MYFDSHSHYDDEAFDMDRDELLKSFKENEIGNVINVGCDIPTSEKAVELANKYDFIYAAVGFHPGNASDYSEQAQEKINLLIKENKKIVAIGEIGLDYHYEGYNRENQKKIFVRQLEIANELNLPVIIHSRDATKDMMEIVKHSNAKGVFHCYSGSMETAREILDLGFYISFSGTVTFKNAKYIKEVAAYVPKDRYLIETDCPYLSPEPNRGKRNSSLNLKYTASHMAALRGVGVLDIMEETTKNTKTLFNIKE